MRKRIYLCLAHMSEAGLEQKYIKEAFDTNWVVPLGPNVNGFEKELEEFLRVNPNLNPNPNLNLNGNDNGNGNVNLNPNLNANPNVNGNGNDNGNGNNK